MFRCEAEPLYKEDNNIKKDVVHYLVEWARQQSHFPKVEAERVFREFIVSCIAISSSMYQGSPEPYYKQHENIKKDEVLNLLEWSKKQSHIPKLSESHVIQFLHSCYYNAEAAKKCMENFYTVRALCPEFFANRDPTSDAIKQNLPVVFFGLLNDPTPEGYRVCLVKIQDSDTEKFNLTELFRIFDMFTWIWWSQVGLNNGVYVVLDMNGCVFGHIKRIQIMALKKYLYYVQEAMPIRLKGIHVINALSFVDIIINMAKPFMKKEFFELIHIHTEMDTFKKVLPIEMMPKDYGGNDKSLEDMDREQKELLRSNKEFFLAHENLIADESKRIGKPKNAGDLFGVEGTFKKLDID